MQKTLLLSLLFFLPRLLFAQWQYLDATITTNDGSKIQGKIAAENWAKSPRTIEFASSGENWKKYSVSDLLGFVVVREDGASLFFERKEVDIEVSAMPLTLSQLETTPELRFQHDTAWIQLIYKGELTLYSLTDKVGKHHLLLSHNGKPPVDLINKVWIKDPFNSSGISKVELYKKQILEMGMDCPEVIDLIVNGNLAKNKAWEIKDSYIIQICEAYDRCKGLLPSYKFKNEKNSFVVSAIIGGHTSTYNPDPFLEKRLTGLTNIHIGLGLDYLLPKTNRRVSFYNEAVVYYDNQLIVDNDNIKPDFRSEFTYKSWQLLISNIFKFHISKHQYSPSIRIGVVNRFRFEQELYWKYAPKAQFSTANSADFTAATMRHELGTTIGVSMKYHRFEIGLRGYMTKAITIGPFYNTSLFAVQLSYKLSRNN